MWRPEKTSDSAGDASLEQSQSFAVYLAALVGSMIAGALFPCALIVAEFAERPYLARRPSGLAEAAVALMIHFFVGAALVGAIGLVTMFVMKVVQEFLDAFRWRAELATSGGAWAMTLAYMFSAEGQLPKPWGLDLFAVLATVAGLVGAGIPAWRLTLRQDSWNGATERRLSPSFSIRDLLVLTLLVAVLAGTLRYAQLSRGQRSVLLTCLAVQILAAAPFWFWVLAHRFRERRSDR